ncbi:hypothetical protein GBAR_LOCUS21039 [Geodia barretti]|uniref:Uncharacterized protein n=1 Tax=Geodia barretti TaxID=519541 RepID=A0AA35SWW2_GEOBA|nr:hypothetical protein GBAR_LOCUS21039 [Geodia barretti]
MRVGGYVWAVYVLIVMCACIASSLVVVSITGMVFQVPIKSWRPDGEAGADLGTTVLWLFAVLPSCYNEAGSLIGYFSARECCVEMEESRSYRYGDRSFPCIVHGFVKTKYSVVEGETLDIVFERNAKGTTKFPLLTIEGRIISEGDEDDYQPVLVTLLRRDSRITLSLTAYNDMIALEDGDKVILRQTSGINNYVNLVEQRGEFISHTMEVAIVDKNNRVEIDLAQSVYTVSEDETGNQVLTLAIKNGLIVQGPIPLRLTAMSLTSPVVNDAERATPRQDFHVETVDIEITPGAAGMTNISLNDIIIDDNTVENHIQRFSLMVEVSEGRVFFDSDNSTKKSVEVAIESDDTVSVSLLSSNVVFYESDESPFNICVIVISEGTDQNCPVEFQVNYTLSFTKYSYTKNGDGETIFRDVTVDKCNNMSCVDLKAVFSIPNDEEFNFQLFNVSLAETELPQSGMFRVSTNVVKFEIRDDDCKLYKWKNHFFKMKGDIEMA